MLNDDGNAFSKTYYAPEDLYFRDYHATLALDLPSDYHAADTWENYDRLKATIDRRYIEWQQSKRSVKRPAGGGSSIRAAAGSCPPGEQLRR
jgi:hypothetical protein